ncbi:MAG: M16 family metallopeptidase [Gammaproteobacteria bacterium]
MNFYSLKRFFTVALVAGVYATCQSPALAKELPPEGGPARDFNLPAIERLTLDNGLRVTMVPFGKIPKTVIRVDVRTGNLNDGDNVWLSDLTTELMKEGTALRSSELIAEQTARMGGSLSIGTGLDQTYVGLSVLSEFATDAIALAAEALRQPAFPADQLERLRSSLQRNLKLSLSRPQSIASSAFVELLYPDHPYGRAYPTEQQLAGYTLEQIKDYYQNNFGAQRSHILVGGQFDRDKVLATIKRNFGDWQRGPAPLVYPPRISSSHRLKLIDRPDAPQSTVIIGLPVPDQASPEYSALAQMQTLLGGYFSSRITANIREDKGYTYSPRSGVNNQFRTAYWTQSADITTEHTGDALNEIFSEIEIMQNELPSEVEVERTQNYQTGTFVLSHATPGGLLARISQMALHGLPNNHLDTYLSKINAITPEQYREMAKKHLLTDQMTIVIVGDLDKVIPQLDSVPALAGATRL